MKSTLSLSLLSLASSAYGSALLGRAPCEICTDFTITVSGGVSGTLGQLSDGQNRVYGGLTPAKYTLYCAGTIFDASGRGCILTPSTSQFQCDSGAPGTGGLSLSSTGQILSQGSNVFHACPTGDNGEYNVYIKSIQSKCVMVTLQANGCGSTATSPPAPAPPAAKCGTTFKSGAYEFPHLIIPVDSSKPNTAAGTSYNGVVSSTVSSIFNFDIPAADAGKTCSLVFLFPTQSQLQTSSYTFSGSGNIDFAKLKSVASSGTDYANQPSVAKDYGITCVAPGHSYAIASFPCPANTVVSFKLSSTDTSLTYFQDYNPSPIGLYITVC